MADSSTRPSASSPAATWVMRPLARPGAPLRLFCIPYAGGGAAVFRHWPRALPAEVDVCAVQLPGRGARFKETPFERLPELVEAMADGLESLMDRSFALFGHSMGGLVAFELARELRRRGAPPPEHLFVAGHRAPRLPEREPPMAHLGDGEFLDEIRRRYAGVPAEILAEPELLELMLPILRADVRLLESYRYRAEPPLACGVSCFGGEQDRQLPRQDLEPWSEETLGAFTLRMLPGDHFFVEAEREALLRALVADLGPAIAPPSAP